jgi:hypothetical protein
LAGLFETHLPIPFHRYRIERNYQPNRFSKEVHVEARTQTETRVWLVSIHEDETTHGDQELYAVNMEMVSQDTPIMESQ